MSKFVIALAASVAALAVASAATAQTSNVAVGLGYGTDGLGPDLLFKVSPNVVIGARAAAGLVNYHKEGEIGGVFTFKGNAHIDGISAHIDLHPWTTGQMVAPLFISAGVLGGDRKVHARGSYFGAPAPIGNGMFVTGAQIGRLDADYDVSDVSPMLTVGWDDTFTTSRAWGVRLVAGLALTNTSDAVSASGGSFSNDPRLIPTLASLEHPLNSDGTKWMRYFPVVQASVTYKF